MAQMARMCVASEQLLFAAQRRENFLRGRHIARVGYAQPMCGTVPCAVGIVDAGFTHQTGGVDGDALSLPGSRLEEHTSELQSPMRHSYAVFCLNKNTSYTQQ